MLFKSILTFTILPVLIPSTYSDTKLLESIGDPRFLSLLETVSGSDSTLGMISKLISEVGLVRDSASVFAQESLSRMGEIETTNSIVHTLLTTVLRLFGFEDNNMARTAINVLSYFSTYLIDYFTGASNLDDNMPRYRLLAQQGFLPFVQEIVHEADRKGREIQNNLLDESLPSTMIERLQSTTGNTTSCVQLFICRSTPLMNTVQKAIKSTLDDDEFRGFYGSNLAVNLWNSAPTLREYIQQGEFCVDNYPLCPLLDL